MLRQDETSESNDQPDPSGTRTPPGQASSAAEQSPSDASPSSIADEAHSSIAAGSAPPAAEGEVRSSIAAGAAPSSVAGEVRSSIVALRPSIADGLVHMLDPRAVALQRTVGWIVTASISPTMLIGIVAALFLIPLPGWASVLLVTLWIASSLVLAWQSHYWPEVEHRHISYRVDGHGIEIRKGVFWRQTISVPRSRVQHIDVSQGPFERSHGLGTLSIYTAGTDHARVGLRGLDHTTALLIRDHLLPCGGDDAV